jgi:hypothetical protein
MKIKSALTRIAAIVAAVSVLQGCSKEPVKVEASSNTSVPVSLLFEHEGCKVYRFEDGGKAIYYSKCRESSQTAWNSTQLVGKVAVSTLQQVSTQIVP